MRDVIKRTLECKCSARCMDDEEDLEATVDAVSAAVELELKERLARALVDAQKITAPYARNVVIHFLEKLQKEL